MENNFNTLKFDLKNYIGILSLNNPEKLNAITKEMRRELLSFWREMQNERACRVIIMTGEGRSFCSGSDVGEMDSEKEPFYKKDVHEIYEFQHEMSEIILSMRRAPQPIIAAIKGYAAGGGFSLAIAADIRIADPTAKFMASYINIGLTSADMGSSFYFPRQTHLGLALEYLYTGDVIDAETAKNIGFVNHVVPTEKLMDKAFELAGKMAEKSLLSLRMTKEAINQNIGPASLESALNLENRNQVLCMKSFPIINPLKKKK
ncbi:MAG: enoyl-CoA hydratase/isomerase family protein [Syntrophorhabdaceae bacterium]|nr:enoyl-CoA hydratase/isomerase family protein [Syntrophorhabdaceae bacterium]